MLRLSPKKSFFPSDERAIRVALYCNGLRAWPHMPISQNWILFLLHVTSRHPSGEKAPFSADTACISRPLLVSQRRTKLSSPDEASHRPSGEKTKPLSQTF